MFSKLLHFTILPVESFYHRHTTNAENYISSLRIFPCSTMLHQRSVQGSNDSRENSRQKFPSIHPSIPFEFLVELVVSKDETPPLSFGPYASIPMERGNGGSPYQEHRPGYHFLRKITIPCEDDGDDLSPRGCQKRLLLLRLMMRDVKRLSRFHPVSIATSMPSKTFNHVAAMKGRERVGDGEKLVSDVNTGIDSSPFDSRGPNAWKKRTVLFFFFFFFLLLSPHSTLFELLAPTNECLRVFCGNSIILRTYCFITDDDYLL